jgi:hypothetical protein
MDRHGLRSTEESFFQRSRWRYSVSALLKSKSPTQYDLLDNGDEIQRECGRKAMFLRHAGEVSERSEYNPPRDCQHSSRLYPRFLTYIPKNAPVVNIANCFSLNKVKSNHFTSQSHFFRGNLEVMRKHDASMRIPIMSAVYRIAP